jgi:hypothetical protein
MDGFTAAFFIILFMFDLGIGIRLVSVERRLETEEKKK